MRPAYGNLAAGPAFALALMPQPEHDDFQGPTLTIGRDYGEAIMHFPKFPRDDLDCHSSATPPAGVDRRNFVSGATSLGAAVSIAGSRALAETSQGRDAMQFQLGYYPWITQHVEQPD